MKYDGVVIEEGHSTEIHLQPKTVSCHLTDAGPPLPEILELKVLEGSDDVNETSIVDSIKSNLTCSWFYLPALSTEVNNIAGKVRKALF